MLLLLAFIPRDEDPLAKIVTSLQHWTDTIPQEKVYLHMDKPYYALGDTIWFKGYVTIGSRHQLSALSGSLYVDLITEKDSIVRSLKLPITSGMVVGNFILGDDFKEGSYRIRSYTQWMRNAGEDYFFDRTFTVGNVANSNIVTKADYQYKDIDGKPVLTATLNYTNDEGKPLAGKDVHYQIMINKKVAWSTSVKTDMQGNIAVRISNENHVDLSGAYITTTLDGSNKNTITRDFPIKAALSQTDVQFFPESGSLVNGIASRIAFKAVGVDGLGVAVKGKIVDETNNQVTEFESFHAGMGSFLLRPVVGKTYSAIISFADGTTKKIALPKATDDGYVLSVYQPNKDSVLVRISTKQSTTPQSVNLIAHTNGETIFASPIKIEKAVTSIWLDKKSFPTGIAQFTIFNNAGEPLNERIAFIRSNDLMQLGIKTAKTTYNSKERVLVNLDAKDSKNKPTFGNFSVTVIDESKVPVDESDESTIFSNLLLTSDLKGYIEKPNYYFTNETDEVNKALDNLMLTQGYRRFSWKELNNTVNTKPQFPVEGLGVVISGKVTTLNNKLVPNANVMLLSVKAGVTKGTSTDANGRFKFDGVFMTDSIKFAVQARTAKNSDKVKVILDSVPKIHLSKNRNIGDVSTNITGTIKAYLNNIKKEDDIYEKTGQLDKVHRLAEVRIRARRPTPSPYKDQGMYRIPEGHADQTYIIPDPENCAMLGNCLGLGLKFVVFKQLGPVIDYPFILYVPPVGAASYVAAAVILDGRKLDINEIGDVFDNNYIDPVGIAKIDIVRTGAMTSLFGGPAIMIYTKRDYIRKNYTPSIANITPKGFNKVREFYSPRYDRPGNADKLPDLRTTIYWNPYLKTDVNGKTTFNYFNADGPGTYKVIVEGINAAGELGRQVYRYTVDGDLASAATNALPLVDNNLALITAPLDSFNKRLPVEKVYLHLDKPYYNIGDTLWFKSYLVDRVNMTPSHLSGLLYVELDNDSSEMVRRISIPIKDGMGWGQIPLPKAIFQEGGFTLRAYTNWMQNFDEDYVFSQRLYLAVPSSNTWLVRSAATIEKVADKNQLQVDIKLNRSDNLASPLSFRKVEVKIFDDWHYIYKETMQTGIDGSLKFSQPVKEKMLSKQFRVQITSLEKADGTKVVQVPLSINRKQNIDLQFLPEGGNLVAGLKSVVGFKAIGEDGKGTPVAGAIVDSKGTEVVSFATIHNGMGSIEFTPKPGEKYSARLSQPLVKGFDLPKINSTGTVMHISNPEQGEAITVSLASLNALSTDSACYLIGTARGVVYYSQKVDLGKPTLSIDKKLFPSGIARIALFKGKRPLNERAVFIDNNDQLSIKITPDKATFHKRDSVGLEIEVKDKSGIPVQGNFSLAVTDDSQVRADSVGNYGIAASLLINSELKGHVESAGYYINRKDKQAWQDLDNLMLTQGWTGYDWAAIFGPAKPAKFEMQKEFKVKGQVTNLLYKPIANASVLISSQKPQFVTTVTADAEGRYEFKGLPQIDSGSFFLQASKANGKKMSFGNVSVDKFKAPAVPETLKDPILPWYVNSDSVQINYVKRKAEKDNDENMKLTGHVLKQVEIKDKKIIKESSRNRNGPGRADLVFDEKDIKESTTLNLYQLIKQKLPGLRVIDYHGMPSLMLNNFLVVIEIDGGGLRISLNMNPTVDELIDELSAFQVATLSSMEVVYSNKYMHYYQKTHQIQQVPPSVVNDSEEMLKGHIPVPTGEEYYCEGPFYKLGFRPGYLEARANVLTNNYVDIAVIVITTKNGNGWFKNRAPNAITYRPLPILYPQQFYSPKYNIVSTVVEPDFRSTLYWEPNITTDQNGKAKVSFYTSDIEDKYTIKVSGIGVDGAIGDGSLKLKPNSIIRNTVIKPPQ